jgi:carbon-monoxide dehydrogenase medium subunit
MYPRKFDYVAPGSIAEAASALGSVDGAKVLAGGMSLLPLMKMRLLSPTLLVDIGRVEGHDTITDHDGHFTIDALVTHDETATSGLVRRHAAALSTAAGWTADVQVRNMGTTCGSLAHADIAADQTAAALALGATMVARSRRGHREIPAADFFVDALTTALEPDEILAHVKVPKGGSSAYDKLGRRGGHSDYAVAGAAAWVQRSNGRVSDARVAVTGVGTKPTLAAGVAEAIIGTDGSDSAVEHAASRATEDLTVLEDLYGSEEYKAHLARVYAARALKAALAM